jgi:hypothetical protein
MRTGTVFITVLFNIDSTFGINPYFLYIILLVFEVEKLGVTWYHTLFSEQEDFLNWESTLFLLYKLKLSFKAIRYRYFGNIGTGYDITHVP